MKITLLHTQDALEDPLDPVLAQIEEALARLGHEPSRIVVDDKVQPVVTALAQSPPSIGHLRQVFCLLERRQTGVKMTSTWKHVELPGCCST